MYSRILASMLLGEQLAIVGSPYVIVMEEVTNPEELARARAQRERFDCNVAWLHAHGAEV